MDGDRPLQLREVAEMIRKADDSQAVVKGLSLLPTLIEAAPDELANYSCKSAEPSGISHVDETANCSMATTKSFLQKLSFKKLELQSLTCAGRFDLSLSAQQHLTGRG